MFFNQKTVSRIDDKASAIVEKIDASKLIGKYKMESKFNGVTLDIDCLSTGCKTVQKICTALPLKERLEKLFKTRKQVLAQSIISLSCFSNLHFA